MDRSPASQQQRFDIRRVLTRKTTIGLSIIGFLILALYGFSSPINWATSIRATVIDEETGKPIAGAAVAGVWSLNSLSGPHAVFTHKATAVTNERGQFVLRGMFPRPRLPLTWYTVHDPDIYIYAPGYRMAALDNFPLAGSYRGPFDWRSARRRSFWHGRVIALPPARTHEEALETLGWMRSHLAGTGLKANDYPEIWLRLAAGWDQVPSHVRAGSTVADPNTDLAYWRSKNR